MGTELPDQTRALPSGEHRACLGLGSNVDPVSNLRRAIRRLRRSVTVEAVSAVWESPAVGLDGPDYSNAALLVRTPQSKEWLRTRLKEIENELGRVRNHSRSARLTIDIDMLVFDQEILEHDLWSQAFRALPVAELLPDMCCPSTGELMSHAAIRLAGSSPIRRRPEILTGSQGTGTSRTKRTSSTRTRTP